MEKPKKPVKDPFENAILDIFEKSAFEISNRRHQQGLAMLKKCEKNLEILVNKGCIVDSDIILATLHNIALCSQSLSILLDCTAYLEACIYNVKSKSSISTKSNKTKKSNKIRKVRYLCLLYLQLADCFSRLKNHKSALASAEKAVKSSILSIKLCLNYCNELKSKKNHNQTSVLSSTKKRLKFDIYFDTHSLLQYLYLQMNGKKLIKAPAELSFRNLLGFLGEADWVADLSFEKIFEIKLLQLDDLKASHNIKAELSRDFMLDKICMAVSSFYLVFRALHSMAQEPLRAKSCLKRAISLSKSFLPSDCPLLMTLTKEYNLYYLKANKCKASFRSRSAKEMRKQQKDKKISQKTHHDLKVLPWIVRSERELVLNNTEKKNEKVHSEEETLKNRLQMSLGYEKTEPEPPLSEESNSDSSSSNKNNHFMLFSSELYGDNYDEEPDKYEYMPLKRT